MANSGLILCNIFIIPLCRIYVWTPFSSLISSNTSICLSMLSGHTITVVKFDPYLFFWGGGGYCPRVIILIYFIMYFRFFFVFVNLVIFSSGTAMPMPEVQGTADKFCVIIQLIFKTIIHTLIYLLACSLSVPHRYFVYIVLSTVLYVTMHLLHRV